jgi:hypothetical protein
LVVLAVSKGGIGSWLSQCGEDLQDLIKALQHDACGINVKPLRTDAEFPDRHTNDGAVDLASMRKEGVQGDSKTSVVEMARLDSLPAKQFLQIEVPQFLLHVTEAMVSLQNADQEGNDAFSMRNRALRRLGKYSVNRFDDLEPIQIGLDDGNRPQYFKANIRLFRSRWHSCFPPASFAGPCYPS